MQRVRSRCLRAGEDHAVLAHRQPRVGDAELAAHDVHEAVHVELRVELPRHRRHAAVVDSAGHDPLERLEVVVDVDREAVGRDAAAHVHADRRDLARLVRPHAGQPLDRPGRDADVGQRGDDRALHAADVLVHVVPVGLQAHDRVADELARPVVGHATAAVGVDDVDPLGAVPVLAHRQLGGLRAPPARVDRRMLEQQQHVLHAARLARRLELLLQRKRLGVGDQPLADAPELAGGVCLRHRQPIVPGARPAGHSPIGAAACRFVPAPGHRGR